MKTKSDKKVNQITKQLNRQLSEDVFGPRFSVRQLKKVGYRDCHEYHAYLFQFQDAVMPERNQCEWLSEGEVIISAKLLLLMNTFIVQSDFWKTFNKEEYFKDKDMCYSCHQYELYNVRKERILKYDQEGQKIEFVGKQAYCKRCHSPMLHVDSIDEYNLEQAQRLYPSVQVLYAFDPTPFRDILGF